jgi:hypothetical protein
MLRKSQGSGLFSCYSGHCSDPKTELDLVRLVFITDFRGSRWRNLTDFTSKPSGLRKLCSTVLSHVSALVFRNRIVFYSTIRCYSKRAVNFTRLYPEGDFGNHHASLRAIHKKTTLLRPRFSLQFCFRQFSAPAKSPDTAKLTETKSDSSFIASVYPF